MRTLKSVSAVVLLVTIVGTILMGCHRRAQVRQDTRQQYRTQERMDKRRNK
jgi:hypothetical protein